MKTFSNILIVLAPFKGLLTAAGVADAIKEGILLAQPGTNVKVLPMADGGTGTVSAVCAALGGEMREVEVIGSMGDIVKAGYIFAPPDLRNPLRATTRGVGQLIKDAMQAGCEEIIIGLGNIFWNL